MRIGIDMDGVLIDTENYFLTHGSNFFWDKYKKTVVNPASSNIAEMFGLDEVAEKEFWDKNYYKYIMEAPRAFASEVISQLGAGANKIYIITARVVNGVKRGVAAEDMQKLVAVWLEKNNIPFDKIVFVEGDKVEACVANKIDVMIEDSPSHINSVSQKIPVICYDARYNQEVKGDNIYRAYSWFDVLSIVTELKKKCKNK